MHSTSGSLLARLRLPSDEAAWSRFVKLYTPLLYYWAQRSGLAAHEGDDLVQEVFAALVQKMPEFTYERGRSFRSWLRTVALNKWREKKRRRQVPVHALDSEPPAEVADPAEQFWDEEYRGHLVRRALELMQADFPEKTWKACWDIVVEGKTAPEIAAAHGSTVGAVYAAKFRVLSRLREELAGMMDCGDQ